MTEAEKVEATNGNQAKNGQAASDLNNSIVKQVTFYFGDYNLPRDKFLQEQVKSNEEGWVGIDTMLKFQRLSKLSNDETVILKALKESEDKLIEVDLENKKIRRNPEIPLPEIEDEATQKNRTVYVKGFEKEKTTLDDLLTFFNQFEGVVYVNRRTWNDQKTNERKFKGSVFVSFKDNALAAKFMDLESVKNPEGEETIRKWQAEYLVEKEKEFKEKKSRRSNEKQSKNKITEEQAKLDEEEEENKLPKGAVLYMDGFKDDTMREDIKKVLKDEFEVENEAIAFVDFERGQTTARLRFAEENAAVKLAAKIKEKLGENEKVKVKETDIEFRVLEGEEEIEYLDKALKDMKNHKGKNRGHKRRGGFRGGHGGKRGRR